MRNTGLNEAQAGVKIARRNVNNLRFADDTTLLAESEQELKSLLMKVKEESENVDLKLNIQKTKIMASSSITSWKIDGETMKTVRDFTFLGSKITADGDCSHEIIRCLLLGRKVMTNLDSIFFFPLIQHTVFISFVMLFCYCYKVQSTIDSIFKSRDITLPTNVHLVKAMVFLVWMWELDSKENWGLKNWCFWTMLNNGLQQVLEKTLESLLDSKIQTVHLKGNQSRIFFGRTDVEAKTPILWPPDAKNWLIWKDPDACMFRERLKVGGEGDDKGWDGWMASPTQWTWVWVSSGSWWGTGKPGVLQFIGLQRVGLDWMTLLNWTDVWIYVSKTGRIYIWGRGN